MQRSGSQKALLVFSILSIIFGVLAIILAMMTMLATGVLAGSEPQSLAEAGISESDQAMGVSAFFFMSVIILISAIWDLLCGIFGIRAANDNQKIMIVWVFTLIGLILGVMGIIASIVNGTFGQDVWSLVFSLVFSVLMFWIANNIKREAGK